MFNLSSFRNETERGERDIKVRVERGGKRICRGKLTRSGGGKRAPGGRAGGISSAWQLGSNRSFILSDNISLLSAKVNISAPARARVYVKTCREKVNILLIFIFVAFRCGGRRRR